MPVKPVTRHDLITRVKNGDLQAGVELVQGDNLETLEQLLQTLCPHLGDVTPTIFDTACDAWRLAEYLSLKETP